jgi:hypothetical protein
VNDGRSFGQLGGKFVVIGDDQFQTDFASEHRFLEAGNAAIDRNDERSAALIERAEGVAIQAIPLFEPIGHVIRDVGTQQAQARIQNGRSGDTVGVVIAIDDDLAAVANGRINAVRGGGRSREQIGIAEARELGVEKRAGGLGFIDAATNQKLRDDGRNRG